MARADDPMLLLYNPANLAALSGKQLLLNANLAAFDACYQRRSARNIYADGVDGGTLSRFGDPNDWAASSWPQVCNEAFPQIAPSLVFVMPLSRGLGLGIGILGPAGVGMGEWGNPDTGEVTVDGQALPPPSRYLVVDQKLQIIYPTVGIGYSPIKGLRLGAAFQWGVARLDYLTYVVPNTGENPALDVRADLEATDAFMPAVIGSAHLVPHDNLDIAVGFRWSDSLEAKAPTRLIFGDYGVGDPDTLMPVNSTVPTTTDVANARIKAPMPWQLSLGVRYADRISPRPTDPAQVERLSGRVEDPMSNEWWDVELDVVYERNSLVDDLEISFPAGTVLETRNIVPDGGSGARLEETELPFPSRVVVPHRWKDQLSFRLGGDYNVMPGLAALRLGFSFETRGIRKGYATPDFLPGMRFGVHAGLTLRLGRFDVSLAYAHLFQETFEVGVDEAAVPQISAVPEAARIVNAGSYSANFDVFSLGLNWHI
jgi:hypothetical protein